MTATLWCSAAVLVIAAVLCLWAAFTGDSGQQPGQHRDWGHTQNLGHYIQTRTGPAADEPPAGWARWYDEHPWPEDGPHGWGGIRD